MKLSKKKVLELCELADCVMVDKKGAQLEFDLTGNDAKIVERWSNENIRREQQEARRALKRCEKLARQGDPKAMFAISARRDLIARKLPLTWQQAVALVDAGISEVA